MAVTPLIATGGIRALQRDFRAMIPDSAVEIREIIKGAIGPMLQVAKDNAPGSGHTIGSPWRATVRGSVGTLTNPHPGAAPWEFGGTIAPRGTPITLTPPAHMIYGGGGAIEKAKGDVEKELIIGFERLARRHGFV